MRPGANSLAEGLLMRLRRPGAGLSKPSKKVGGWPVDAATTAVGVRVPARGDSTEGLLCWLPGIAPGAPFWRRMLAYHVHGWVGSDVCGGTPDGTRKISAGLLMGPAEGPAPGVWWSKIVRWDSEGTEKRLLSGETQPER